MHVIKNEYLRMPKNEYLHENNQNLNKNGDGNNGGENGGVTGGIKKAPGEMCIRDRILSDEELAVEKVTLSTTGKAIEFAVSGGVVDGACSLSYTNFTVSIIY